MTREIDDDEDDGGAIPVCCPSEAARDEGEARRATGELVLEAALDLHEAGYRPVVLYPAGYPRPHDRRGPATGKDPYGKQWGLREVNAVTLRKEMGRFIKE